jgi:histidyl-tRNA synthetase
MGDVVISLLLQQLGRIPVLSLSPAPILVTVFSPEFQPASLKLAADLRALDFNVTCFPEPAKLPRQFKFADRMGMRVVLVIGPDEAAAGKVTLKNLGDGTQSTLNQVEVPGALRLILESR